MGKPKKTRRATRASDVLTRLGNLKPGALLSARHADDNVIFEKQHALQMAELQRKGICF